MKYIFLFPLGKQAEKEIKAQISYALSQFAQQWTDHGEQVHMEIEFPYDSLLLIKAWKDSGGRIDGCAQDALFRFIKELSKHLQLPLLRFDLMPLVIDQKVIFLSFMELKEKLHKGEITPDTPVILFSVRQEDEWEKMPIPLRETAFYKQLTQ